MYGGEVFGHKFTVFTAVTKFWKSVNIWRRYRHELLVRFVWDTTCCDGNNLYYFTDTPIRVAGSLLIHTTCVYSRSIETSTFTWEPVEGTVLEAHRGTRQSSACWDLCVRWGTWLWKRVGRRETDVHAGTRYLVLDFCSHVGNKIK